MPKEGRERDESRELNANFPSASLAANGLTTEKKGLLALNLLTPPFTGGEASQGLSDAGQEGALVHLLHLMTAT